MIDILAAAHLGSAVLALMTTGLIAAGFVRLAWLARGLVRHMAVGILIIHFAVFLRTLYRDIAPLLLPDDAWLFSPVGFLAVALVLNVFIVVACWHALSALYLAIPEPQRRGYSVLTAALYPPWRRHRRPPLP